MSPHIMELIPDGGEVALCGVIGVSVTTVSVHINKASIGRDDRSGGRDGGSF